MSIIDCLLSNAAMAAGIALLAVLVGRLAKKPQVTHALWVLVLVKLVTPPFVHIPVGYPGADPLEAVAVADSARSHAGVSPARPPGGVPVTHHESEEFTQPSRVSPVVSGRRMETHGRRGAASAFTVPWATLLIGAWIAGSLIWFLLAGIRLYRFNRLLRSAQPASKGLQAEVCSVARRYGLRRLPRVLVVDSSLPPLIFSFGWRTSMVLPRALLDSLGVGERMGLLAHELAHLRRHDDWIRRVEFVVLGVHWWNPIAWWARKAIQQAEEECCDAWVMWAFPNTASLYAQTLVDTVDFLAGSSRLKPEAATAFNQGYSLKRRVEMIFSERTSRRMSWGVRTILVLFAAIVVPLSLLGASSDQAERKALNQDGKSASRGESGAESASVEEGRGVQGASEERRTLRGQVVAPDGQAVAGAIVDVQAVYDSDPPQNPPKRVITEADGRFQIDLGTSGLRFVTVIASAEGYGLGWENVLKEDDMTIRLVEEGPAIEGRIVDADGRPVADANVSVLSISTSTEEDLTAWVEALETAKEVHSLLVRYMRRAATELPLPPLKTGADGAFVLKSVGVERMATLRIDSPAIETSFVNVMTRPAERVELPYYRDAPTLGTSVFYGAAFEHCVRAAKPIVGVVRDKDTGKPLAGVRLRGEPPLHAAGMLKWVETTSDAEGKYRLTGLPRSSRTEILAVPPDDQPYMLSQLKVKDVAESQDTTLDFALKRGLWIDGQVTDMVAGKPVKDAAIFYYAFTDNPNAKDAAGLTGAMRGWIAPYHISPDGSFRRVGLPGRGLIAVRMTGDHEYRFGIGAEKIEGGQSTQGRKLFRTVPTMCSSANFNTIVEVNPAEGQKRYECNVEVDPGDTVTGEVLDPDGKPLVGALVWGGDDFGGPWAHEPLEGSTFSAKGYDPGKPRQMYFLHKPRRLAGRLRIAGEKPGELAVRLQPWATITGRILDAEGKPKGGLEVQSDPGPKPGDTSGPLPR